MQELNAHAYNIFVVVADGNEAEESDGEEGENGALDEEGSDEEGKTRICFTCR